MGHYLSEIGFPSSSRENDKHEKVIKSLTKHKVTVGEFLMIELPKVMIIIKKKRNSIGSYKASDQDFMIVRSRIAQILRSRRTR